MRHCKVILLGEAAVGKTSIISRYINNKFEDSVQSTVGAAFFAKEIKLENGNEYTLNIWDTAGAEIFRSINKLFYRDASIALLVYDITNKESYEELKNYWLDQIKREAGNQISK